MDANDLATREVYRARCVVVRCLIASHYTTYRLHICVCIMHDA